MNLKNFVEEQENLDVVFNMISKLYGDSMSESDIQKITQLVYDKVIEIQKLKKEIKTTNKDMIQEVMEALKVSEEEVADSLIFFSLVVENVYYTEKLKETLI